MTCLGHERVAGQAVADAARAINIDEIDADLADARAMMTALRDALFGCADAMIGGVAMGLYLFDRSDELRYVTALSFSPDGKVLVVTDRGNRADRPDSGGVSLWDRAAGKLLRKLATPGEQVSAIISRA